MRAWNRKRKPKHHGKPRWEHHEFNHYDIWTGKRGKVFKHRLRNIDLKEPKLCCCIVGKIKLRYHVI